MAESHGKTTATAKSQPAPAQGGASSVLASLRRATAAAHQQLEDDSPLLQPQATQTGYFAYLRAISPLIAAAEAMVLPLASVVAHEGYPLQQVCRHRLLLADLTQAPEGLVTKLPTQADENKARAAFAEALQPHANFGGRFGILYVLEGSTLGGQVLCRELTRRLALEPRHLSYLAGHGQATGARWKQTRSLLERHLVTPAQRAQACAAANAMFLLFGRAVATVSLRANA